MSRAAVLVVSPMTPKLRVRREPTLPTTAGPVLTPTRNVGQVGCASASGPAGPDDGEAGRRGALGVVRLVAAGIEDRHDAVADEVLDDAAGRIDDRHDGAPVSLSMPMTSVGVRVSLNVVNDARSANRTLTSRSSPPSSATSGLALADPCATTVGRYGRNAASSRSTSRAAWARSVISSSDAPSRRRSARTLIGRLAAGIRRDDGRDGASAYQRSTRDSVASRYRPPNAAVERAAAAVLASARPGRSRRTRPAAAGATPTSSRASCG